MAARGPRGKSGALKGVGLPATVSPELARTAGQYIGADKKSGRDQITLVVPRDWADCTQIELSLEQAREGLVRHGGKE